MSLFFCYPFLLRLLQCTLTIFVVFIDTSNSIPSWALQNFFELFFFPSSENLVSQQYQFLSKYKVVSELKYHFIPRTSLLHKIQDFMCIFVFWSYIEWWILGDSGELQLRFQIVLGSEAEWGLRGYPVFLAR